MVKLRTAVVGCARSGTLSTVKGVNKLYASLAPIGRGVMEGEPSGVLHHEQVFRLDEARSYTEASSSELCDHADFPKMLSATEEEFFECSWLMVPWLREMMRPLGEVFHLVRDPRDQIRSNLYIFAWEGWPWGKFARNFLRKRGVTLPEGAPEVEAALYWLHWNRMIHERTIGARATHRVLLTEKMGALDYVNILQSYMGAGFVHARLDAVRCPPSHYDLSEKAKRRHIDGKERDRRNDTFELSDLPAVLRESVESEYRLLQGLAENARPRKWPFLVRPQRPVV